MRESPVGTAGVLDVDRRITLVKPPSHYREPLARLTPPGRR